MSTGVSVCALVLDAATANISACQHLGCRFNPDDIKTDFTIDGHRVFVFHDISHALKLLRNLLGDFDLLSDDGVVSWRYIVKLVELQGDYGLRTANSLTLKHAFYEGAKMKTCYATKVISK